jgi:hypothetical protein
MTPWAARSAPVLVTVLLGAVGYCAPHAAGSPTPITSPSFPAAPVPGMDFYVDPVNGWSISYPFGWRVDGSNPSFVQIHDPANAALVGIRVWPTDLPLNAVVDQMLASERQLQQQSGVTNVVKSRQLNVLPNGNPFVDLRLERGPAGRSHQIYVVKGGRAFGVNAEASAASWGAFRPDFDRILQSFAPPV